MVGELALSGRNRGLPLRRRRGQGPHLAKRWEPRGFLELRRQCGVSHEVGQGPQGASLVVPGMSGLHSCGEGERVITLESW